MANYNIGPKIGIEGEREFRSQISRINKEYAAMESYTKAVVTAMDQQGKSQELLAAKSNSLRQQLGLQQQKFEELSQALAKAKENFSENSQEVLRLEGAILDVKNTTAALQRELDNTDDELRRMEMGLDDVGDAADESADEMLTFSDVLKAGIASGAILNALETAGDLIIDIGGQAITAAADIKAANSQFSQTFGDLESTATNALRSISGETGIATTRLQEGYTALYAFTKSVGGDSESALNIAQRALTAAADSAAYYDRSMEDATETLQSFLKGNYENDAALGIAATETTRNAKANELYAKSFNELTEAQKVDTLLAMVEAGNKASGALGQAAREADSWANVTGELSEAWRQLLASLGGPVMEGLIPIIQRITGGLQRMTAVASWRELRNGVDDFTDGIDAADAALASSNTEIAATSELADQYVKKLQSLEAAGLNTAESQREYQQVVSLLNTLLPGLNLQIDENTGRISQNTSELGANIKAMQDQAREQAKQAYYTKIIEESQKAYEALFDAETSQQELLAEQNALLERGAQVYDDLSYAQTGSTKTMEEFNASLTDDDKRLAEVNRELEALDTEIKNANASIASANDKLAAATAACEDYADGSDEVVSAAQRQVDAQNALDQAYSAIRSAAAESINSQIGLFDKMATKNEWSAKKIIANWQKQKKAFDNYSTNLQKAVDLGLDETLVQQLSDGSQESMMILDALVNDTKISVSDINASFAGVSESKDNAVNAMTEVRAGMSAEYAQLEADLANETQQAMNSAAEAAKSNSGKLGNAMAEARIAANSQFGGPLYLATKAAGESAMAGGALGISNNQYRIRNAMIDARTGATSQFGAPLYDAMKGAGESAMAGGALGISNNQYRIRNAMINARTGAASQYGPPLYDAMKGAGESAMAGGALGISNNQYRIQNAMINARTGAASQYGAPLATSLESAGGSVMAGAAKGITDNTWRVRNAMKEAVDAANRAYRNGWEINSPSRVMERNSDYIIDGAVLQIRRRTSDLAGAMSSLAKSGNNAYLKEQLDYAAAYPAMAANAPGYGSTTNNSVAYGGISININTQPGQDSQSIADAVLQELTIRLGQEEAAF